MDNKSNQLPDFIVIGGMKCGSTSLYEYLAAHPDTSACKLKEPSFFSKEWERGLDWYRSLYKPTDKIKFEASTSYSKYPWFEESPSRIKSTLPDVRLIYIIRHPIKRLKSQIHHNLLVGRLTEEQVSHPDFWSELGGEYINFSMYHMQIEKYLQHFDREALKVLTLEDLSADPVGVLTDISEFVGLSPAYFRDEFNYEEFNVSGSRTRLKSDIFNRGLRYLNRKGVIPDVHNKLSSKVPRPGFRDEDIELMWSRIDPDMVKLEEFMGRSLGFRRNAELVD